MGFSVLPCYHCSHRSQESSVMPCFHAVVAPCDLQEESQIPMGSTQSPKCSSSCCLQDGIFPNSPLPPHAWPHKSACTSPNKLRCFTSHFCEMFPFPELFLFPLPTSNNPTRIQVTLALPSGNQLSPHTVNSFIRALLRTLLLARQLSKTGPGSCLAWSHNAARTGYLVESTDFVVKWGFNPWTTTRQSSDLKQVQALDSWSVKWG